MKTQRELTTLDKLIKDTGMFCSIKSLLKNLEDYQKLLNTKEHLYIIQREFEIIRVEIYRLEDQLSWIVEQSKKWEGSE